MRNGLGEARASRGRSYESLVFKPLCVASKRSDSSARSDESVFQHAGLSQSVNCTSARQKIGKLERESDHHGNELRSLGAGPDRVVPSLHKERRTKATEREADATVETEIGLLVTQALELVDRPADVLRHSAVIDADTADQVGPDHRLRERQHEVRRRTEEIHVPGDVPVTLGRQHHIANTADHRVVEIAPTPEELAAKPEVGRAYPDEAVRDQSGLGATSEVTAVWDVRADRSAKTQARFL